jgi:hypothetical protein
MIKQIGGRAGRFDPLEAKVEPGLVTTFLPQDLPLVLKAMTTPLAPTLQRAVVGLTMEMAVTVGQYIPNHASLLALQDILTNCAQVGKTFLFQQMDIRKDLEEISADLTLQERLLVLYAPAGKQKQAIDCLRLYLEAYQTGQEVDFMEALKEVGLDAELDNAMVVIAKIKDFENETSALFLGSNSPTSKSEGSNGETLEMQIRRTRQSLSVESRNVLLPLEMIHQALSSYIWLSYRLMPFSKSQAAFELKAKVLEAMQTLLKFTTSGHSSEILQSTKKPPPPTEDSYDFSREKVGQRQGYISISGLFGPEDEVQTAEIY